MKTAFKALLAAILVLGVSTPFSSKAFVAPSAATNQAVAADGFYGNVSGQRKDNLSQSNKTNYYADLAINATGNAGAVWVQNGPNPGASEVLATFWDGSKWVGKLNPNGPDNISGTPGVGSGVPAIVFDHNDNPMIAWGEGIGNGEARFVRWTGSAWRGMNGTTPYDVVDAGAATWPGKLSLAVNPANGYPAIAMGGVYVMRWNGSNWNGFTGAAYDYLSSGLPRNHSQPIIKFDNNGKPHVAWFVQGSYYYDRSIYYARFNGTNWSGLGGGPIDVVNTNTGLIESVPDLAIEQTTGVPAIVWAGTDTGAPQKTGIIFKHWNGGTWRGHSGAPFDFAAETPAFAQPHIATSVGGAIGVLFSSDTNYNISYVQWLGSKWRGISQLAPQPVGPLSPGGFADLELDYYSYPNILGVIGDNPSNSDQVNIYFTRWKGFPIN